MLELRLPLNIKKALLVGVFLLILVHASMATNYYVKPTGSDAANGTSEATAWQHVMKACSTVNAGDTVFIRAGVYDETSNLTSTAWGYPIQSGLVPSRSGAAGAYIVFKGYRGDTRPIIKGKSPSYGAPNTANYRMGVLLNNEHHLIYDSLEFRFGPTGFFLQGGGPHDIIIRNCVIDSMLGLGGAPLDDNSGGIVTYYEQGTRNITVENNEIFACGAWSSGGSHAANYRKYFNTGGMWLYTCDSCLIRNNKIHDVMNGIRFKEEARYTEVYGNTFYNIAYAAMWSHSGQRFAYTGPDHVMSRWHHNVAYNFGICFNVGEGTGGGVQDDTLLYVYNNTCDCSNSGVWIDSGNGSVWGGVQGTEGGFGKAYFFNNIFYNVPAMYNADATDHAGAFNIWYASHPIFQIYEDYNMVYGQGTGQYYAIGSSEYTLAQWKAASISQMVAGQGAHSVMSNPGFNNPAAHDYSITPASAAASGGRPGSFTFFPGTSRARTVTFPDTATYFGVKNTSNMLYLGAIPPNGTPPPPDSTVSVAAAGAVTEGGTLAFPVTIGTTFGGICTVHYNTVDGTAVSPGDFTAVTNGTINIAAGATSGTINVPTINDSEIEPTEALSVVITSVSIGKVGTSTAAGSIVDNDVAPRTRVKFEQLPSHTLAVSGTYSGYATTPIADTIIDAYGGIPTTWASDEDNAAAHWVELNFGQQISVSGVTVFWAYNSFRSTLTTSTQYRIQRWNGSAYVDVTTVNNSTQSASTDTTFPPITTDRIRIYQPAAQGPSDYTAIMWLTEIQLWSPQDTVPPAAVTDLR